jgi:two-component system OmpR family sensor kinase
MRSLRRTLAVRFSLTNFLALLLISLWAFLGTHYSLSRQLDESLKSTLQLEAATLAARLPVVFQPGSNDLDSFVRQVNRFITVRDSAGNALSANTVFAVNLPIDWDSFESALSHEQKLTSQSWNRHRMRSLYAAVPAGSPGNAAVVQVAASLEPLGEVERRIFFLMLATVLLGTAATMAGASWLARGAVAPIAAVTAQAEGVTPGSVGNRITAHADLAEFTGLVGVLNQMLERLEGAYQQQRRIIADLGHDLRTPLTAMQGELEVALRSDRSINEYRTVLESCLEEVEHLSSIGDSLVLLARIEAGELQPELAPMNLTDLASDAVKRLRPRTEGRIMEIHGTTGVDGEAMVDQKMIGLVLDHLLYNAVQHTPSGTRVDVTVSSNETSVQIAVDDDGPGISDELIPYLFERLYRADLARTRSPGAGLGLTISAAIMDAHHGSIAAAPSNLGGLQVMLELPRAAPNTASGSGPLTTLEG